MVNKPTLKLSGRIFYFSNNLQKPLTPEEVDGTGLSLQKISRATIIENKLCFDFDETGDYYGGHVKAFVYEDDRVLGKAHYLDRSIEDDTIDAMMYRNSKGCMLVGKWWTGNIITSFIAELNYVESFEDEKLSKQKGGACAM